MNSSQRVLDFLFCRWAIDESPTVQHQLRRITLSSVIAIAGLLILATLNSLSQVTYSAIIDIVFIAIIIAINIGIRFKLSYKTSLALLTALYFVFCIAIALLEIQEYSGIIWILLLPIIAISAIGRRVGLICSISGGLLMAFILFDNGLLNILPTDYDFGFNIRFLLAYTIITLLVHCSEALRIRLETDLRQKNHELEYLARTDSLTGLSNRMDILDKIQYEAIRCERTHRSFCLILGDIDRFKAINDQYGHSSGDAVLKSVAATMMDTIRAQDAVAYWATDDPMIYGYSSRYGGEEFLIMLPETELKGAENAAEKLRCKISGLQVYLPDRATPIQITMSFGVALCQRQNDIESAIDQADQMLYRAKNEGRNQVQCSVQ